MKNRNNTMGGTKMKWFPIATLIAAGILSADAATMICDFETVKTNGWSVYSDQQKKGEVTIADDAVSGDKALKVTLAGCRQYRGVQYSLAPVMPAGATGVSFLIKPVTGAPPVWLALAESRKRYGKILAKGRAPIKTQGNDWQKVTIRFSDLIGDGKKPFTSLKPGAIYTLSFYVPISEQRSEFLLDDIVWETK